MGIVHLLLVASLGTASDTVVAARPGDRLDLSELDGEVTIVTWGRDAVRISDDDDPRGSVPLVRRGNRLTLEGRRLDRSLRIEVPEWMPMELRGREVSVRIRGSRADVSVRILEGSVEIEDVTGTVDVHTVDGEIRARNVEGKVRLRSDDEDVRVRGARGTLTVIATDGDVILDDIDVDRLDASTTDGDVSFSGRLRAGARHTLSTHDGDVVARLPEGSDVDVEVSTYSGSFEAGFPITLERIRSGERTRFTLGSGGATLSLQAFDGDIVLRRSGG